MGFLGMKSRDEVWDEVAAATGGVVIGRGDFWNGGPRVEAPVEGGPWTVALDIYVVPIMMGKVMVPMSFSRACALFLARGGLRLSVSRANPFTGVGKLFGMQDLEVGDAAFDRAFVIKGSDAEQTLRLLSGEPGATLRQMLTGLPDTSFGVADDGRAANKESEVPEGTDVVYAVRSTTGGAELVAMYGLVAETLRGLYRIGSASNEPVSDPSGGR